MCDFYHIIASDINNLQIAVDNKLDTEQLWVTFYNLYPNTTAELYGKIYPDKNIDDIIFTYNVFPDFMSIEDFRNILSINNYEILNRVKIPRVQSFYDQIVNCINLFGVELIPREFLYPTLLHAINVLNNIKYPDKFNTIDKFNTNRHQIILRLLERQNTFVAIERLYKENKLEYAALHGYYQIIKEIIYMKIKKSDIYNTAREFHLNPYGKNEDLEKGILSVLDKFFEKGKDVVIEDERQKMLSYWKYIANIEYNKPNIENITNPENCLLENTLDYGPYDAISFIEDDRLYVVTSCEFKSVLEKGENPWTRGKLRDDVKLAIECKLEQYKCSPSNTKIVRSFSEALDYHIKIYNEPELPEPEHQPRQQNIYSRIADLLGEYYINENGLRNITEEHLQRLITYIQETGVNVPLLYSYSVDAIFTYILFQAALNQNRLPSIAMAISTIISEIQDEQMNNEEDSEIIEFENREN